VSGVELDQVTWTSGETASGSVMAQYRAHGDSVPAVLNGERLTFSSPQEAVAPGQTVAFYDGDRVLGGALIADTFL
jgi:tRNA-specific 2-thiouridylase